MLVSYSGAFLILFVTMYYFCPPQHLSSWIARLAGANKYAVHVSIPRHVAKLYQTKHTNITYAHAHSHLKYKRVTTQSSRAHAVGKIILQARAPNTRWVHLSGQFFRGGGLLVESWTVERWSDSLVASNGWGKRGERAGIPTPPHARVSHREGCVKTWMMPPSTTPRTHRRRRHW